MGSEKKPFVPKTPMDFQKLKLDRLMANPDKPVIIPESPREKKGFSVPEFVRNVMGSSAGAGSGEFHVYRHLRRKEYTRQKVIDEKAEKEKLDEEFQAKLEENKRKMEEKTEKKRLKRLKRKQKMKQKPKGSKKENRISQEQDDNSDSEESDDINQSDNEQPEKIQSASEQPEKIQSASEQPEKIQSANEQPEKIQSTSEINENSQDSPSSEDPKNLVKEHLVLKEDAICDVES